MDSIIKSNKCLKYHEWIDSVTVKHPNDLSKMEVELYINSSIPYEGGTVNLRVSDLLIGEDEPDFFPKDYTILKLFSCFGYLEEVKREVYNKRWRSDKKELIARPLNRALGQLIDLINDAFEEEKDNEQV